MSDRSLRLRPQLGTGQRGVYVRLHLENPARPPQSRGANQLVAGDHISTDRNLYAHHGIYTGAGTVVHYHKGPDGTGRIAETSLDTFAAGATVRLVRRPDPAADPDAIVDRARARIGETDYNLFANNCEHLAMDAFRVDGTRRHLPSSSSRVSDLEGKVSALEFRIAELQRSTGQ